MDNKFAMRRERDITDAVVKHARNAFSVAQLNWPEHLFLKTRVYWTKNKASGIEALDIPEFGLQDVLQNLSIRGGMKEILFRYGQKTVAAKDRPKGIPATASPIAISISVETIMVSDWKPMEGGDRKVRGIPVFLVAGRTENGRQALRLYPIAITEIYRIKLRNGDEIVGALIDEDEKAVYIRDSKENEYRIKRGDIVDKVLCNQLRRLGITPPPELAQKVEAMKELSEDFLAPFFDGYKQGDGDPKDHFITS